MGWVIGLAYIFIIKSAKVIDKNGHSNRIIDYKIKRQKPLEQELVWKFIKIDSDKEDLNIFRTTMKHLDISNNWLENSNKENFNRITWIRVYITQL